jgi:hypothetical protein
MKHRSTVMTLKLSNNDHDKKPLPHHNHIHRKTKEMFPLITRPLCTKSMLQKLRHFYLWVLRHLCDAACHKQPQKCDSSGWQIYTTIDIPTQQIFVKHGISQVTHPIYSPDMAPCDFSSLNLKIHSVAKDLMMRKQMNIISFIRPTILKFLACPPPPPPEVIISICKHIYCRQYQGTVPKPVCPMGLTYTHRQYC